MRWPFRGSSIADYMALFSQCLEVPADEVEGVAAEVGTHLEEATEAITGPRKDAEVQATLALGSPRELAARIGAARRHRRPVRVLVIDPPVQYLKYEVPGDPIRVHRRDLAWGLALPAYGLLGYWTGVAFGQRLPTFSIAAAIAAVILVAGRWVLPRLTPTETTRLLFGSMVVIIACAAVTGTLYLGRFVQGDPALWVAPLCYAAVLAAGLCYGLLNPNSPLAIGSRRLIDSANPPE
jgi:hypothetical protein